MFSVNILTHYKLFENFGLVIKQHTNRNRRNALLNTKASTSTKLQKSNQNGSRKIKSVSGKKQSMTLVTNTLTLETQHQIHEYIKSKKDKITSLKLLAYLLLNETSRNNFLTQSEKVLNCKDISALHAYHGNKLHDELKDDQIVLDTSTVLNLRQILMLVIQQGGIDCLYELSHPQYSRMVTPEMAQFRGYMPIITLPILPDGFVCNDDYYVITKWFYYPIRYFNDKQFAKKNSKSGDVVVLNCSGMGLKALESKLSNKNIVKLIHSKCTRVTFRYTVDGREEKRAIIMTSPHQFKLNDFMVTHHKQLLEYGYLESVTSQILGKYSKISTIDTMSGTRDEIHAEAFVKSVIDKIKIAIDSRKSKVIYKIGIYDVNIGLAAPKGSGKTTMAQTVKEYISNLKQVKLNGLRVNVLDSDAYNVWLACGQPKKYGVDFLNDLVKTHKTGIFELTANRVLTLFKIKTWSDYYAKLNDLLLTLRRELKPYFHTDPNPTEDSNSLQSFLKKVASEANREEILIFQIHSTYEIPSLPGTDTIMTVLPIWNTSISITEREMQPSTNPYQRLEQKLLHDHFQSISSSMRTASYLSSYLRMFVAYRDY